MIRLSGWVVEGIFLEGIRRTRFIDVLGESVFANPFLFPLLWCLYPLRRIESFILSELFNFLLSSFVRLHGLWRKREGISFMVCGGFHHLPLP